MRINCKNVCLLLATFLHVVGSYAQDSGGRPIVTTAKNLLSQTGFYQKCAEMGLVELDSKSARYALFQGRNYLSHIFGEEEALALSELWLENGKNGILIIEPNVSEEAGEFPFSSNFCQKTKEEIDQQFKWMMDALEAPKQ